jgi:lysophospholipase L1-like esterase
VSNSTRLRISLGRVVALLAVGAVAVNAAAANAKTHPKPQYYLALGDSVADVPPGNQSYPYRILAHYQRKLGSLTLTNLAVPGATTGSMRAGGQYQAALQFLRAHRGHVALITIDIGGNDFVGCVGFSGVDQACETQALTTIRQNLGPMIAGLRSAAPHVELIGMTYYNPFLGNWLAGGAARSLTLGTVPGLVTLNQELTGLYGGPNKTADVQGAFKETDFNTIVSSPWGSVPIAVERACSWLDIVCNTGALEGFGEHPNPTGAAVIASAFERRIGTLHRR